MPTKKSIVRPEDTSGEPRLAFFLTAEDTLLFYKLLNGYRLTDGRGERLDFLIREHYEDTFGEYLTEPWEWSE